MGKFIDRTGEISINKQGLSMKIISYRSNADLDILFEDGYIAEHKDYRNFSNGYIKNPNFDYCKKKNRLGEEFKTNCGATVKIIEYNNANDLKVECLETKEIISSCYRNLTTGNVKPKFFPYVRGVGFIGNETTLDNKGKTLHSYKTWEGMLERAYSEKYHLKEPSYKNVTVCEEWHNYSNFKKWYEDNYYEIEGESMALDKDILVKGNKVYSPKTCVFVPKTINSLFVKPSISKKDLPIGVSVVNGRYRAKSGSNHLGAFNTPEEAFYAYKEFKEKYIKQIADKYKPYIPQNLYEAMYRYEVEITD